MKKFLLLFKSISRIVIVVYVLIFAGIFFFQEKLLFYPSSIDDNTLEHIRKNYSHVTEHSLETAEGNRLHGWVVDNTSNEGHGIIFYFGGNAEEVSSRIQEMRTLDGWRIVLFNYRGYGLSEGAPGQEALFNDALLVYDRFAPTERRDNFKIVIMGWSLGTGVAVHVAHKRPIDGIFLISPYDSITHIAQQQYPFMPVAFAIRHPFDSISIAPSIRAPVRIITASGDRLIPHENSASLAAAWGGPVKLLQVSGYDHNSLTDGPEYTQYLSESLVFFAGN